jgi:hypothetical protein
MWLPSVLVAEHLFAECSTSASFAAPLNAKIDGIVQTKIHADDPPLTAEIIESTIRRRLDMSVK